MLNDDKNSSAEVYELVPAVERITATGRKVTVNRPRIALRKDWRDVIEKQKAEAANHPAWLQQIQFRFQVCDLYSQGCTMSNIAGMLGTNRQKVSVIVHRFARTRGEA